MRAVLIAAAAPRGEQRARTAPVGARPHGRAVPALLGAAGAAALLAGCLVVDNPAYCTSSAACPDDRLCDRRSNRCLSDETGCGDREDGVRGCSADRGQSGACAGGVLVADRICPVDAPCHYGGCTPETEQPCEHWPDCGTEAACGTYRDPATDRTYLGCALPLGSYDAELTCQDGAPAPQCRSGQCAGGRCFYPCLADEDCPPWSCREVTTTMEGREMTVRTCLP